jgi:hypothetical protein
MKIITPVFAARPCKSSIYRQTRGILENAFYYPKDLELPKLALNFAADNVS